MLANNDIYTGSTNPTANVNPKTLGSLYINYNTGKMFVCKDNTLNKNVWLLCNPDIPVQKKEFGTKLYCYPKAGDIYKPREKYTNTLDYNLAIWLISPYT